MGTKRDKKKKKRDPTVSAKNKIKRKEEEEEEENIEELIEEFKRSQTANVTSVTCAPSRRANASMITCPITFNIYFFGGEFYDGKKTAMYDEFYHYSIDKGEWKKVCLSESPGPRSSHQMVAFPNGTLYLFGGEFVSPNETSFFHYKDFWRFNIKGNYWEKLRIKVPPARSGHRMVAYKHYIVLFGGFYDTFKETKYFDDLWIYDTLIGEWSLIPVSDPKPEPRSGFQFLAFSDYILLYGGYCKKVVKGEKASGIVYSDIWILTIDSKTHSIKWEKKRKANGFVPSLRSGCTMTHYKSKGILFGGVSDIKESEDTLESICHNDMYQYHENNKWYPLTLKKNEYEGPIPRFNTMMTVSKNTLYLYGGILELGNKEFYLQDFWSLPLDKLNEWNCIRSDDTSRSTWLGEESDDSSSDSEESCQLDESEDILEEEILPLDTFESSIMIDDPAPKESLREYFLRTGTEWQRRAIELFEKLSESPSFSGKSLRRDAFQMAQERFKICQPALSILRQKLEQEEAILIQKQEKSNESISFRHRDR